ncbi:uncharacterized protein LOC115440967 isoform X2 [Manduca sexta]|uniref:uncharacterized protein LOC115440967 isoform X2 n=1 Tax=Manduca sexta TaxID=7130 RepID=UPI001181D287|nr:uncharacterized protein LOC115440967 isoform X2 [Manduca sexta]
MSVVCCDTAAAACLLNNRTIDGTYDRPYYYKGVSYGLHARVQLRPVSVAPLAAVLLQLSLLVPHQEHMSWLHAVVALALAASAAPATTSCKNCIALGKEEKAMFRAHSDACLPQSGVEPKVVESMLNGQLVESAALRRHVYCVLMKCKLVSKEGKLMKNAMLGKMAMRSDGKNATKVLEGCADQTGDTPEDLAWNLFRCGYDKKTMLFDYMPTSGASSGDIDNISK